MNKEWIRVESIPPISHKGRPQLQLQPGEILCRPAKTSGAAGGYNRSFERTGRLDYHAAERTVDGQLYLYIWRDFEEEKQNGSR